MPCCRADSLKIDSDRWPVRSWNTLKSMLRGLLPTWNGLRPGTNTANAFFARSDSSQTRANGSAISTAMLSGEKHHATLASHPRLARVSDSTSSASGPKDMPGKVSTHKDRSNVGSTAVAGETREALSHGAGGWGTLEARETFAVSDLPLRTLRAIPAKWVGVAGADVPGSGDGEATGEEEVASYFLLLRCGVVWLIVVTRLVGVGIGGRVPSVVVTASAVLSASLIKSIVLATSTPRMTAIMFPRSRSSWLRRWWWSATAPACT